MSKDINKIKEDIKGIRDLLHEILNERKVEEKPITNMEYLIINLIYGLSEGLIEMADACKWELKRLEENCKLNK